jgi:hypothetical protein
VERTSAPRRDACSPAPREEASSAAGLRGRAPPPGRAGRRPPPEPLAPPAGEGGPGKEGLATAREEPTKRERNGKGGVAGGCCAFIIKEIDKWTPQWIEDDIEYG